MGLKGVEITWLAHSTFQIVTPEGKKLLVDPWVESNPQCPKAFHDAGFDGILITHGHNDHIGDVFACAERSTGPIVGIFDLTSWLGLKGVESDRLVGMNKGGTVEIEDLKIRVTMTDARHSSSFQTEDGQIQYLGEAAGLVVEFSNGGTLYIAGDTSLFGDMEWIGELYEPDVAILPIGDHFTMDPHQAAIACELVGVEEVIPCHFGTFPLLTGTPAMLSERLADLEIDTEVIALEPGGSTKW